MERTIIKSANPRQYQRRSMVQDVQLNHLAGIDNAVELFGADKSEL